VQGTDTDNDHQQTDQQADDDSELFGATVVRHHMWTGNQAGFLEKFLSL